MKGGQQNRRQSARSRERQLSVRAVRRDPPDLRKLSRAVLALAQAEMEAEAQALAAKEITEREAPKESDHDSE